MQFLRKLTPFYWASCAFVIVLHTVLKFDGFYPGGIAFSFGMMLPIALIGMYVTTREHPKSRQLTFNIIWLLAMVYLAMNDVFEFV